ncbi:hypothetical protein [Hyphomonas sp. KY3]|uniref:hypothetical protein n=1 Tax=Hyphomonas sp. KY3 TaxID=2016196 RepID=UPI001A904959|nr:hypothetical protein [Hyphomonas sp. KY3]QSR22789.1 phosphoribosyltransferase [Hyphomonas sp. KY3]
MNYRSLADMYDAITMGLGRLPDNIDLIVGVPRSGLIPANFLGLLLNLPITDVEGLIEGRVMASGRTRRGAAVNKTFAEMKNVLVIDDSVFHGNSIRAVKERLDVELEGYNLTYCAVFGPKMTHPDIDIVLDAVPQPRIFQWNLFHHGLLKECCIDIDGVLCLDPTAQQNDDGNRYREFILNAIPLNRPTKPLGHLVTSRLEKYRPETEAWLEKWGIQYESLNMLDLPNKEARQKAKAHGSFKAEVYRNKNSIMFIESEHDQAVEIARLSGKPALCIETQQMHMPASGDLRTIQQSMKGLPRRIVLQKTPLSNKQSMKNFVRSIVGDRGYALMKKVSGRS